MNAGRGGDYCNMQCNELAIKYVTFYYDRGGEYEISTADIYDSIGAVGSIGNRD